MGPKTPGFEEALHTVFGVKEYYFNPDAGKVNLKANLNRVLEYDQ